METRTDLTSLRDWIPFFQSSVWPLATLAIVFWFRRALADAVDSVRDRVRWGDTLELSSSGLKLGSDVRPAELSRAGENPSAPRHLPNTIYLVHTALPDRLRSTAERSFYQVRIFLDADTPELLDDVERVVYHLHSTFARPVRESSDRASAFELRTSVWGEFNMFAEVHLRSETKPLEIERYISL